MSADEAAKRATQAYRIADAKESLDVAYSMLKDATALVDYARGKLFAALESEAKE